MIHIVRLFSPRKPDEGLRIGTVRRPPRGVPKENYAKMNVFDIWFPLLSPSNELLYSYRDEEIDWPGFQRKFILEMKQPAPKMALDLLAKLSHQTNFAVGCYCGNEANCHRSLLRQLLQERDAVLDKAPQEPES